MMMNPMMGDQAAIQNQMNLANAMKMNSLQPIQNVSPVPGSELSWTQVLANALQGHVANSMQNKAMQNQQMMAQRMQGDAEQAINELEAGLQSDDPRGAIARAMIHYHPLVQQAAKTAEKGLIAPRDIARGATPESLIASKGNINNLEAKVELEDVTPGKLTRNKNTGQIINPDIAPGAGANIVNIGGDLYQQTPTGLDQINKAPRINNTVNLPRAETAFDQAYGAGQGKYASDYVATRGELIDSLEAANRGLKLLDQGIHAGALAPIAKGLDKASIAVFKTDPEKAARTEEFTSTVAQQVLTALQQMGGPDSDSDRKYLQGVMAGDITYEPAAMKRILTRVRDRFSRKIRAGDQILEHNRNRGVDLPTTLPGTLPNADTGTGNDLDSFLKSKGF